MKILNLRFKNLNSLYGEWNIDFTNESYLNDGIFAITGPTGAGKSTVLDAICLGLYGSTPRLQKINSSINDIMSRNTGECFSEVTFKTSKGVYRAYWEQHRAHRKADGKLTDSSHEISNVDDGTIISNKKSEVKSVIEDITGMDIDRFTRSALLAQGSFSAFLKASIDQKARILQQITGTEIYSKISIEVHRRKSENDQELKLLEAQIGETVLLPKDEEDSLIERKSKVLEEENKLGTKVKETQEKINSYESYSRITRELSELKNSLSSLQPLGDELKPLRLKLSKAKKALSINGLYIQLEEKNKSLNKINNDISNIKTTLPELFKELETAKVEFECFNNNFDKFKIEKEKEERLINRVRQQDFDIRELGNRCSKSNEIIQNINKFIEQNFFEKEKLESEFESLSLEIEKINFFIDKSFNIDDLQNRFSEVKIKSGTVKSNLNRQRFLNDKLGNITKEIQSLKNSFQKQEKLQTEYKDSEKNITVNIDNCKSEIIKILDGSSIKDLRREKDFLIKEISYIGKINSLEEERTRLVEGKPCPLCGSIDHPFSSGVPEKSDVEKKLELFEDRINSCEDIEDKVKNFEVRLNELSQEKQNIDNSLIELKVKIKGLSSSKDEIDLELKSIEESNIKSLLEIKSILKLESDLTEGNYEGFIQKAGDDISKIKAVLDEKNIKDKRILEISTQLTALKAAIEQKNIELRNENGALSNSKRELEFKNNERIEIFGNKSTDEVELQLKRDLNYNLEKYSSKKDTLQLLESRSTQLKSSLTSLETEKEKLFKNTQELEGEFSLKLQESEFINKDEFLLSLIPENEINSIDSRIRDYDKKIVEIESGINDREGREKELKVQLSEVNIDALKNSLYAMDHELKELRSELGSIMEKLENNNKNKDKFKAQQHRITKQKAECFKWGKLHSLIGSNDGKKFRKFAQGLTFEVMVSHANRQLRKMSDRYLLVRDENEPLELNVIDNYIAGESRTSRNLSGGESFIISLALALGLSSMTSNKVQVDSLFLDEGFGTLDKDSLDIALDTLSSLHQEGKMIGLISHVPAIKERIPTQISVFQISGGRSKLAGPGCHKN